MHHKTHALADARLGSAAESAFLNVAGKLLDAYEGPDFAGKQGLPLEDATEAGFYGGDDETRTRDLCRDRAAL